MKKLTQISLLTAILIDSSLAVAGGWDIALVQTQEAAKKAESMKTLPTNGIVSSGFGTRIHPVTDEEKEHKGIDIAARSGEPIHAAEMGRIQFVGDKGSFGLTVEVIHLDGSVTRYAHASATYVKQGQRVHKNEMIATVGSTGLVTGPHLHFEHIIDGEHIDPLKHVQLSKKSGQVEQEANNQEVMTAWRLTLDQSRIVAPSKLDAVTTQSVMESLETQINTDLEQALALTATFDVGPLEHI